MIKTLRNIVAFFSLGIASQAFAAGPLAEFINYYKIILHGLGFDGPHLHDWYAVLGGLFTLTMLTITGLKFKSSLEKAGDDIAPENHFSLRTFFEMALDFVIDIGNDVIGPEACKKYLPLLCGLFFFILFSNLSGLVPGFPPATESINTNLAMALLVFIIYQWAGLKEHKGSYIKHFLGPIALLAPLIFLIEMISHFARPVSLSLRLYGNIFGDHLVLSVFTGLTKVIVPAFLLFFGTLVAFLQSFVFTLLSSIYISMAISHDH